MYEWKCDLCESSYIGETSRNFYSRSLEHMDKATKKSDDSFIFNHQKECHNGSQPQLKTNVLKSFQDPLSRQVADGVYIRRNQGLVKGAELCLNPYFFGWLEK